MAMFEESTARERSGTYCYYRLEVGGSVNVGDVDLKLPDLAGVGPAGCRWVRCAQTAADIRTSASATVGCPHEYRC